jgi:DNA-binding MarR family transcriptional regulator
LAVSPGATRDIVALANRLRPVLLRLNRHLRREVHSLGVTGGQVSLLVAIAKQPGTGVRALAARENMSAAAMSKHVDRLERAGLVRRTAGFGGDNRRVGLTVTPEGARVLRSVRSRRTAWLASRLEELSEEEVGALEHALEPLARLLGDDE